MSKGLVITEKPSVARDIARALGGFETGDDYFENDKYVVSWAVGHLLEFVAPEEIDPKYKRWVLEDLPIIPDEFQYSPKSGQSERLKVLKKLYGRSDVSEVINACDAGREGELIFREILWYFHKFKNAPTPREMRRLWLQSMTTGAIKEGFTKLEDGRNFDGLSDAAVCRSEADWLIGINATRALTRRMKTRNERTAWSAGRVQTPTLALLVDREIENLTHRPTPFWRLQAKFQAGDHAYSGTWFDPNFEPDPDLPQKDDWITDKKTLDTIAETVANKPGGAEETRKLTKETARQLFDLTSLQREANSRFGYSARRTLQAAQRLYEGYKLLTYPRTDSKCLPNDYRDHVNQVLHSFSQGGTYSRFAATLKKDGLRNTSRVFDDSKVSDHFAIVPTGQRPPANLSGDDERIFDLVMRRFLAAFYPPAEWMKVERTTVVEGHHFRTRGRFLHVPGWYEVYGKDAAEETDVLAELGKAGAGWSDRVKASAGSLPQLKSGQSLILCDSTESESDQTRPPARYSEARLLSLMEHAGRQVNDDEITEVLRGKGLGTPATRADIIENLVTKQYARRAERTLRATPKGILLIDLLRRMGADRLSSPLLTGEMEMRLQEVEQGQRTREQYIQEVVEYTEDIVEKAKTFQYDELYQGDAPLGPCPIAPQLQVVERSRFYCSEDNLGKDSAGVGFIIWKERNGRYLDRVTIRELLEHGETPLLEGFLSANGQGYSGILKLNEKGELQLVSEDGTPMGGSVAEITEDSQPVCPCPFGSGRMIFETETTYQCQCDDSCKEAYPKIKKVAILPKIVCKREMSVEEAKKFFVDGITEEIPDFISRYGRPFKAKLKLKDNGKHGFEFAPREPKKKKDGATKSKAKSKTKAKAKRKSTKGKKKAASKAKKTKAKAKKSKKKTSAGVAG
ncbi:MAG: DNA topoisomerase 3 [Vulcanimicrobiota bacterium]